MINQPVPQCDVDESKFRFPKDENGLPLHIFLVTVKLVEENNNSPWRYVIFAVTGSEAHEKIVQYLNQGEYREGNYRVSVEMARVASGNMGIIEL